jgi:HEAT repeat protein
MNNFDFYQDSDTIESREVLFNFPLAVGIEQDLQLISLLSDLAPDNPWNERKLAAEKIGEIRSSEALPGLLFVLVTDAFWMVRCAIVQALEKIGDPDAVPTLREVAKNDGFKIVRSYAERAADRLSQAG